MALTVMMSIPAFAAAEKASLSINVSDVTLGQTAQAQIVFNADNIGAVSAVVEYDPEILEFVSGTDAHSPDKGKVNVVMVAGAEGKTELSSVLNFNTLKEGAASVKVVSSRVLDFSSEIEIGAPTATADFNVKTDVQAKVISLNVTEPERTVYPKGANPDTDGLKVVANYSDGSAQDVTLQCEIQGLDTSSVGEKTVLVSFGGCSESFKLHVFGFKSAKLTLMAKIIINFTVDFGGADADGYTMGTLFFKEKPSDDEMLRAYRAGEGITEHGTNNGYPMFGYDDVTSKEMNDLVYCVLYAAKGEDVYFTKATSMSAAKYVASAFNNYREELLRTVLADMLNYGSAAQTYFNYNADVPANSGLTAEQKAYASKNNAELASYAKSIRDELSSEQVKFKSVGLTLENEISVNYSAAVTGGQVKDIRLLVFDDYTEGGTYDNSTARYKNPMTLSGDVYKGKFTNLSAKEMRKMLYVRVHVTYEDGTEAYSNIYRYSIETYANIVRSGNYPASLKALTEAMMKYGDSAAKYFG